MAWKKGVLREFQAAIPRFFPDAQRPSLHRRSAHEYLRAPAPADRGCSRQAESNQGRAARLGDGRGRELDVVERARAEKSQLASLAGKARNVARHDDVVSRGAELNQRNILPGK